MAKEKKPVHKVEPSEKRLYKRPGSSKSPVPFNL